MGLSLGLDLTGAAVGSAGVPTFTPGNSSLVVSPNPFDAGTGGTLTGTYRDAEDDPMVGLAWTRARILDAIDPAASTVSVTPAEIEDDDTQEAVITVALFWVSDGLPVVGLPATLIDCAVSGTGNTVTAVQSMMNAAGTIQFAVTSSVAQVKTITVTIQGEALDDTPTFTVTGNPVVTLDHFVDWRTATGSTTAAVTDGGKIVNLNNGTNGKLVVVTAASIGWDDITGLDNVCAQSFNPGVGLSVGGYTYPGFSSTAWLESVAIGASQWRRWYFQNSIPDGSNIGGNGGDHGIQSNVGGIQLYTRINVGSGGVFNFDIGSGVPETTYRTSLNKDARYRMTIVLTRVSTTAYLCEPYIYDDAEVLVKEPDDFVNTSNGALNLGNTALAYTDAVALFESMIFGSSGNSPSGPYEGGTIYWGAFAESSDGDPGPYPTPGSGEAA